jgi:hypothetical protein
MPASDVGAQRAAPNMQRTNSQQPPNTTPNQPACRRYITVKGFSWCPSIAGIGDNSEIVEQKLIKLNVRIVGPLKLSSFERDYPDPDWERFSDAQYWCACTRLQVKRLRRSLQDQGPFGRGLYAFDRRRCGATSFDQHCLFVAGRNLERALQRLGRDARQHFPKESLRALHLLGNIYEHWDELRSAFRSGELVKAAEKLAKEFPGAEPWSLQIFPDGDVVAANTVSLRKLDRDVRNFEARLWWRLRELERQGRHKATKSPPNKSSR